MEMAINDRAVIGDNSGGRTRCIFRAHGDRGYTKLKNSFLQDRRISDETRGLIARLLSLPEDWEVTVMSIIASGKAGRDKVYRMLKEAELFGYVKPEQARQGGKFDKQLYLVSDDPEALIARAAQEIHALETVANLPLTEKPDAVEMAENKYISPLTDLPFTAEPLTEEPLTGSPLTENPTRKKNIEDKINIIPNPPPPEGGSRSRSSVPDQYPADFEQFWRAYPRKEGKGNALKSWKRMTVGQRKRALAGVEKQQRRLQALSASERGNYCPFPATWLNQARYDDEPESGSTMPGQPDLSAMLAKHDDLYRNVR